MMRNGATLASAAMKSIPTRDGLEANKEALQHNDALFFKSRALNRYFSYGAHLLISICYLFCINKVIIA